MDISIIICTYNRSKLLRQCIESVEGLIVPEGLSWEVLIVDNNSTDDTKSAAEYMQKSGKLNTRYVFEKKQGLSFARNKGVAEAGGGIVAFIDDDSVVDKGWLKAIIETFSKYGADCVGGRISPLDWPKKVPAWFNEELYKYTGIYDQGDKVIELSGPFALPYGGNAAYKKGVFTKAGLFDTGLGRVGKGSVYGGEEQELEQKIIKSGGKIFYQPGAIVYHPLRPEMLARKYFRGMDFKTGEKAGLKFGEYGKRTIFGVPLFAINQFLRSVYRYIKAVIKDGYSNSFRKELYCWYFLGFMSGRIKYTSGHKYNNLHV